MAVVHGPISIKDLCRWPNGLCGFALVRQTTSSVWPAARWAIVEPALNTGCVLARTHGFDFRSEEI